LRWLLLFEGYEQKIWVTPRKANVGTIADASSCLDINYIRIQEEEEEEESLTFLSGSKRTADIKLNRSLLTFI
jgi:hypothetical protein